jgi:hypothetical protein
MGRRHYRAAEGPRRAGPGRCAGGGGLVPQSDLSSNPILARGRR